jgi:hypothetical protein
MNNEQKLTLLIGVLKTYAEAKTCYNLNPDYEYPYHNCDIFEDGANYGEITFARTLLEQIGVEFEYPSMRKEE